MPEARASNLGHGMHELTVYFERAGDFVLLVRLEGVTVRELDISISPAETDSMTCDLTFAPLARANVVVCGAGEPVSFGVTPRDKFANAQEEPPSSYYRLQRLPPTNQRRGARASASRRRAIRRLVPSDEGAGRRR